MRTDPPTTAAGLPRRGPAEGTAVDPPPVSPHDRAVLERFAAGLERLFPDDAPEQP
ncbi:hypothetical protein [Streptomonospora litoralis]|uniref:Uncharacterized protein n=1 Tax=Streptomonospora litoralis TaxID=2498135 RepID=A0A4P6Q431_9ACTN|nr:hypothetical protein [Streptomonospora litoralis]QBI53467.1 hypothetical protein EKD16_08365 [Streptomonospora litoralis]